MKKKEKKGNDTILKIENIKICNTYQFELLIIKSIHLSSFNLDVKLSHIK